VRIAGALVVTAISVLGACGGSDAKDSPTPPDRAESAISWPRPPQTAKLAKAAGLELERAELLAYHVHAHLDVFVDGQRVEVPAAIGIADDPAVKEFPVRVGYRLRGDRSKRGL
jgi:hypothetical protein